MSTICSSNGRHLSCTNSDGKSTPRRKSVTDILQATSRNLVVGPLQLGGVHPDDGPDARQGRERQNRATLVFFCSFSVLTRSSVTAADDGTIDTDCFLIRGICTVTAGPKKSPGRQIWIHTDDFIEMESRSFSSRSFWCA